MNPGPNYHFWLAPLISLALQGSLIFVLGWGLQWFVRSAAWRRTLWQVALMGMGLAGALELSGISSVAMSSAGAWLRSMTHRPRLASDTAKVIETTRAVRASSELPTTLLDVAIAAPEAALPMRHETPRFETIWWPGILWLAGFGFVAGRAFLARLFLLGFRSRRSIEVDPSLVKHVQALGSLIGIQKAARVICLKGLTGPITFGTFRPTIGLPAQFSLQSSPERRDAMLMHELAHLAARDPLWYLLADCVTALLWWHPLVWWGRRQFESACESAADEASLLVKNGPEALAECLVELGRRLAAPASFGWLGIEGNGFRSGLGRRVSRLLQTSGGTWRPIHSGLGWLARTSGPVLLAAIGVIGVAWALPNEDEPGSKTVAEGWRNSVAGLTLVTFGGGYGTIAGQAPTAGAPQPSLDALIEDAKLLLEAGKLDQAEGLLDEVLKIDPVNTTASHMWNIVQERRKAKATQSPPKATFTNTPLAQFQPILGITQSTVRGPVISGNLAEPSRKNLGASITNSGARHNLVHGSQAREELLLKLGRIRLTEVGFETTPLNKVLKELSEMARQNDPQKTGINLLLNGVFNTNGTQSEIGLTAININPPLRGITLKDALDAITKTADHPIKYSVEDYAVVFSPRGPENPMLHTRIFHVDPNTFAHSLKGVVGWRPGTTNEPEFTLLGDYPSTKPGSYLRYLTRGTEDQDLANGLRDFFQDAGVVLDPPKSVFFNERSGLLMVRTTLEDLDTIEKATQVLNMSPRQVTIEARVCEISEDTESALGMDWLPTSITGTNSASSTSTGILNANQFQVMLKALAEQSGINLLTAPKITTLSARQSQIKVVDVKYVVTDLNISTNGIQPITEPIELGPVLDVVPYVSADGFTIQMTVIASIKEFLGYGNAEGFVAAIHETAKTGDLNAVTTNSTPLPKFRLRQVVTSGVVYDGQTLVLSGGSFAENVKAESKVPLLGDLPLAGRLFRSESSTKMKKKLLIFVTPTVIDPAGNRIHSEEEILFFRKGIEE